MKLFVTGVAGQLGHDVMNELNKRGYEGLGSDLAPEYSGIQDSTAVTTIPYISVDITDASAVEKAITEAGVDGVVHCAAWTAVDAAEDEDKQEIVRKVNVLGTENIAKVCKKLGIKMMYLSTDYVFDGQGTTPWEPDCKAYKPLNVYLGFSAWCDNNRILIGTRRYLEQEGVPLPDEEYEMQHSKNGELQILYLAVSGNLHAMFVLKYVGGRNVARGLAVLQKENIRLLVTCQDPSLTAHHITEAYRLPEGMITVLDQEQCNAIKAAPEDPEDTCCMIHLKAFASLTGGLQAADQAQNAESSATTVQMVSVLFSIIIAALLTSAGSIWELSVATVLMYQAAWSALSIAVCALKQHN